MGGSCAGVAGAAAAQRPLQIPLRCNVRMMPCARHAVGITSASIGAQRSSRLRVLLRSRQPANTQVVGVAGAPSAIKRPRRGQSIKKHAVSQRLSYPSRLRVPPVPPPVPQPQGALHQALLHCLGSYVRALTAHSIRVNLPLVTGLDRGALPATGCSELREGES